MKNFARDSLLFAALYLSFVAASEKEWYVQTQTFGSRDFHVFPELNAASTTGLIIGWILFGLVLIITAIITFIATWNRNVEYNKNLEESRARLKQLGLDWTQVDRDFEDLQRGGNEEKEAENFMDVALKEGQKIREAGRADNRL